jgi:hypothetical protein
MVLLVIASARRVTVLQSAARSNGGSFHALIAQASVDAGNTCADIPKLCRRRKKRAAGLMGAFPTVSTMRRVLAIDPPKKSQR